MQFPPQHDYYGYVSRTCVFWKAYCERRFLNLFFEQILLVEEKNDGGIGEPFVVTDRVKQLQALLHSVLKEEKKMVCDTDVLDIRRRMRACMVSLKIVRIE